MTAPHSPNRIVSEISQMPDVIMKRTDIWSYGGGTQSIAIAVLVAQGRLPKPKHVIFADTGREASETMEYFETNVKPIFDKCGLVLEVAPHSLATVDLYDKNGLTLIPAFTSHKGNAGASRAMCSNEWKKRVISRYLRSLGYGPTKPVRSWIGISRDEIGRAKENDVAWNENYYPLLFGVTMSRQDCYALIAEYGLPHPPKSSCWMCPYRRNPQWRRLRDFYPDDFQKAIELDEEIRAKDKFNAVYLHDSRVPLKDANLEDEPERNGYLFGEVDHCDSGYCWV